MLVLAGNSLTIIVQRAEWLVSCIAPRDVTLYCQLYGAWDVDIARVHFWNDPTTVPDVGLG